jgi:dienelactone hydrolase
VAVLALVVVVAGDVLRLAAGRDEPLVLPAPPGPYQVGRATFDWTDTSRSDPLGPRPGAPRELSVWLWYPAPPDAVGEALPYAPGAWAGLHLQGPLALFEADFAAVRDHARGHVPAAAGRFPVVVLEPGLGFSAPQYTVLAEHLASRGYLVAGLTPTYSANLTVWHGHPVASTAAGNPRDLGGHTGPAAVSADRLVDVWAADAHYVATAVAGLDRAGRFANRVDPARVSYIGHSFGGAAALQACSTDSRCTGAVDLDGTQFGTVVHDGLHVPLMILGSQDSCVTGTCSAQSAEDRADRDTARSLLAASTGGVRCYSTVGARHFNATDDAVLHLARPVRALFALGSIDGERGLAIQDAYVDAFLDQTTRARPQRLLGPASPPFPEVHALCAAGPLVERPRSTR